MNDLPIVFNTAILFVHPFDGDCNPIV